MKNILLITGLCFSTLLPLTALAEEDPNDLIQYRKNVMKAIGSNMKGMVAILKGKIDQKESLNELANGLSSASTSSLVIGAFEKNTHGKGSEKTTSTEKIWSDWESFKKVSKDMEMAALEIKVLAEKGELTEFSQLKPALKQCAQCHKKSGYRTKK